MGPRPTGFRLLAFSDLFLSWLGRETHQINSLARRDFNSRRIRGKRLLPTFSSTSPPASPGARAN